MTRALFRFAAALRKTQVFYQKYRFLSNKTNMKILTASSNLSHLNPPTHSATKNSGTSSLFPIPTPARASASRTRAAACAPFGARPLASGDLTTSSQVHLVRGIPSRAPVGSLSHRALRAKTFAESEELLISHELKAHQL